MNKLRPTSALCALAIFLAPASAHAAWPGAEGRIALVVSPDAGSAPIYESRIVTVRPNGSDPVVVRMCRPMNAGPCSQTESVRSLAWSPDGKRLAVAVGGRIAIVNADGSDWRFVTPGVSYDRYPSWSPDGRRIAFSRTHLPSLAKDLFLVRADGGGERRLVGGDGVGDTAWSSRGQLAYTSTRGGRIVKVDARGRHRRVLARGSNSTGLDWSPDGSRLLFHKGRDYGSSTAWTVDTRGRERRVSSRLVNAFWSPTGRRLATMGGPRFDLIRSNGSRIRTVTPRTSTAWGTPVAQAWQPVPRR